MKRFPKKDIILPAITALLAVGTAGNAQAAANPFSDLPADHWAYDAVTELAANNVVEGYGDTTFRGDRIITRYEMAQMVAKFMARTDWGASDRARLNKLAAEFSAELDSLGARVGALERNADMVKWNGTLRYRYFNKLEKDEIMKKRTRYQYATLRLDPSMEINEHWSGHARFDFNWDMSHDIEVTGTTRGTSAHARIPESRLRRLYVRGDYKNFQVLLGKLPYLSIIDNGMVYDEASPAPNSPLATKSRRPLLPAAPAISSP